VVSSSPPGSKAAHQKRRGYIKGLDTQIRSEFATSEVFGPRPLQFLLEPPQSQQIS